jgi:hypothetical protein
LSASKVCHSFRRPHWKRHQTHLQGRPKATLTSSLSAVGLYTYALENPSCPGVGRSKRRVLVWRRSQLGVSSNRGRLPTSLVVSFVRIGKSSAQARRSIPSVRGRARWRMRTGAGSFVPKNLVRLVRAALVCPSSASGSDGLAEQSFNYSMASSSTSRQPPSIFSAAPHLRPS